MVNPLILNVHGVMLLSVANIVLHITFLTLRHFKAIGSRAGRSLFPFEILEIVDRELKTKKFASECTAAYLASLQSFVTYNIANRLGEVRRSHGMFDALERDGEWDADTDLSMGASGG